MKFSEKSSRTIHELGNIELHDLGQISRTVPCQSCWKHVPEGLIFCSCGICVRLDEEQIRRIKARFEAMIVLYYRACVNYSRGKRLGEAEWQKRPLESTRRPWQNDEMYRESQKVHGWTEDYCRYLDFLTTDISYSASYWYPMMMIDKLDRREREKMLSPPRKLSQIFDENKDDRTLIFRRTREHGTDHSMKHCEQTWHGTAKIGKPSGGKLPPHHLHNKRWQYELQDTQWRDQHWWKE